MKLTTEFNCRVYDDETGDYLALTYDSECDLITIESYASDKAEGRLVVPPELARRLASALNRIADLNSNKTIVNIAMGGPVGGDMSGGMAAATEALREFLRTQRAQSRKDWLDKAAAESHH